MELQIQVATTQESDLIINITHVYISTELWLITVVLDNVSSDTTD